MAGKKGFGEALTLDPSLKEKRKNRIYRIGIELEGGWNEVPKGSRVIRDGSVDLRSLALPRYTEIAIGELPSPPQSITTWQAWVATNYPVYLNETCGMHVHMSFNNAFTYQRLMDDRYPATILKYMEEWAKREGLPADNPLWPRLKGESRYCQHVFDPDGQVGNTGKDYDQTRSGHRYTVINYCWQRYSTLECRLLPMMPSAPIAISAIKELLDITNLFLVATAKREKILKGESTCPQDEATTIKRIFI